MKFNLILSLAVACLIAASTTAAPLFNEVLINPPGSDDDVEFIEIGSDTGGVESLDGFSVLLIEGDGGGSGIIDQVIPLTGMSTDAGGLIAIMEMLPDTELLLENGTITMAIVDGFTGAVDDDLDSGDAGVLDSTPWTSVSDAFAITDGGGSDHMYAALMGFADSGISDFTPDMVALTDVGLIGADLFDDMGVLTVDPDETALYNGTQIMVPSDFGPTKGMANPSAIVPEPTTAVLALLALCGLAVVRRR